MNPPRLSRCPVARSGVSFSTFSNARSVASFIWTHPSNRGGRFLALARSGVFQLRGRLLQRRTKARLGSRSLIWADRRRSSSARVVYANPPDFPEMMVWRRHLEPGDLFVDVGANIGVYSIWAAEAGASVIAIEPAPDTCDLLRENARLNGYRVEVLQVAAAASSGVTLFSSGRDVTDRIDPSGSIEVETLDLDSLIGDRRVSGMKIDVEGFEVEVLRGCARALLEKRIGLLQLEWNRTSESATGHDRRPVAEFLTELGYSLFRPGNDTYLVPVGCSPDYGPDVFARPAEKPAPT